MSTSYNLGKVMVTGRGEYADGVTYNPLDIVTYGGSGYLVLQQVTGVVPGTNPAYYMILVEKGRQGDPGQAATVTVGTVTTLAPGSNASVTNSGTANNAILNFSLPRGSQGASGGLIDVIQLNSVPLTITSKTVNIPVDNALSAGSTNPVQNSVIQNAISTINSNITGITDSKGAASGIATLDANTKVVASQASAAMVTVTANRTLVLTDAGKFIRANSANEITITIPTNSSVAFPVGTEMEFCRWGEGNVKFAAASGVTIYSQDSMINISSQYSTCGLKKIDTNIWLLSGSLA
jgi:hypothetical protein